jgi:hypothetical protein
MPLETKYKEYTKILQGWPPIPKKAEPQVHSHRWSQRQGGLKGLKRAKRAWTTARIPMLLAQANAHYCQRVPYPFPHVANPRSQYIVK